MKVTSEMIKVRPVRAELKRGFGDEILNGVLCLSAPLIKNKLRNEGLSVVAPSPIQTLR